MTIRTRLRPKLTQAKNDRSFIDYRKTFPEQWPLMGEFRTKSGTNSHFAG